MKNFLICFFAVFIFEACYNDDGANETRAEIIAKDFIANELILPDDVDFGACSVEKTDINEYHVVYKIKALNAFGVKMPKRASVRLSYVGNGDWSDINNWVCHKISFLDEITGQITERNFVSTDKEIEAILNKTITLGGIEFDVIERTKHSIRVYHKDKINDISIIKKIYADMKKMD